MDVVKAYSRRSLFRAIFFMGILCALTDGAVYVALDFAYARIAEMSASGTALQETRDMLDIIRQFYIPATTGLYLLFALLLWIGSRSSLAALMKKHTIQQAKPAKADISPKKSAEAEKKARERSDQRFFLHLFSVLQREGRLMDFLSEDMEEYEDEEIGAAVRSIQENCKKAMTKYISAQPVVEEEEDDEITVPPGFDPNMIKLTGNVTGEPPFRGVVRHRGWKARKIEMPALSGDRDPAIIAPAEVEIL